MLKGYDVATRSVPCYSDKSNLVVIKHKDSDLYYEMINKAFVDDVNEASFFVSENDANVLIEGYNLSDFEAIIIKLKFDTFKNKYYVSQ